MLEYDRIDISEGIYFNKTKEIKKNVIYILSVFLGKGFKYEPYLCNVCHDLMQKAMNFNNIAIVSIKESDYRIHFWYMNINDVINIMKIFNLNEKSGIVINFLSYMKMSDKTTYYRKNWGIIPNRAKEYYENNRERLR